MLKKTNAIALYMFAFFLTSLPSLAKEIQSEKDLKTEIKNYISHHLEDTHDFSLFSFTNNLGKHVYVGIPLPVILWDEGLKVFSTSKLKNGECIVKMGYSFYKLEHGKIYKTDSGLWKHEQKCIDIANKNKEKETIKEKEESFRCCKEDVLQQKKI